MSSLGFPKPQSEQNYFCGIQFHKGPWPWPWPWLLAFTNPLNISPALYFGRNFKYLRGGFIFIGGNHNFGGKKKHNKKVYFVLRLLASYPPGSAHFPPLSWFHFAIRSILFLIPHFARESNQTNSVPQYTINVSHFTCFIYSSK